MKIRLRLLKSLRHTRNRIFAFSGFRRSKSQIVNYKILEQIASQTTLKIDFGGGLKSDADLKIAFDSGANQITGGSIAIKNRALFENGFKNTVLKIIWWTPTMKKWPYQVVGRIR
jgi:hypothetical protein